MDKDDHNIAVNSKDWKQNMPTKMSWIKLWHINRMVYYIIIKIDQYRKNIAQCIVKNLHRTGYNVHVCDVYAVCTYIRVSDS